MNSTERTMLLKRIELIRSERELETTRLIGLRKMAAEKPSLRSFIYETRWWRREQPMTLNPKRLRSIADGLERYSNSTPPHDDGWCGYGDGLRAARENAAEEAAEIYGMVELLEEQCAE